MSNPFNLALEYLRGDLAILRALDCRDDDPDVASCVAAVAVLEAVGQTPDRWAVEVALTNPTIESWQINILLAILAALPSPTGEKEKL